MSAYEPVIALTRGLHVLTVVNTLRSASIPEIQRETGLHRATIVRMLETLEHAGFVMRRDGGRRFLPTGRVLLLANGFQAHERAAQIAEPILAELREEVGWPSDLAIFDGDAMLIAATSRPFGDLLLKRRLGARAPVLASALGRAYLAACTPEEQVEILDQLAKSSQPFDKPAGNPSSVKKLLADIQALGYASPDPNYSKIVYDSATSGFAVAVQANGRVMASLNMMFLTGTISLDHAVTAFLPAVRRAADTIGAAMAQDFSPTANPQISRGTPA